MNLDGYKKREYLTITELDTFARCPRAYFYKAGCGFRAVPVDGQSGSQAMFFGTCIHKAIGAYFSRFELDDAFKVFAADWGDTLGDEKRNGDTARMMLASFASKHPKGGGLYTPLPPPQSIVEIDKGDKISDWEIPFAIDIGLPIPLMGRMDGWCRSNITGEIFLNEYKTSYEISKRFFDGFRRSPQVIGYTLAARTGALPDVRGCYVEALKSAKTSWDTQILPVDVPDFEIERFVKWAQILGNQILECEERGDWPQFPTGCHPYSQFGIVGYLCEYDALCSVPEWQTMKQFYNVDRHIPYILKVKGKEIEHV